MLRKAHLILIGLLCASPAFAQTSGTVRLYDEGTLQGTIQNVDCIGSTIACARVGVTGTLTLSGGGGGAPTDATYWVGAAHAGLSAEINLGALGTGLVINTAGTPSIYAGVTCTNQVLRILGASGAGTCVTIDSTYTSGTFPATAHNLLSATHGDTSAAAALRGAVIRGNSTPAWERLALGGANLYLKSNATDLIYSTLAAGGVGGCTNQAVITLNADAVPSCSTINTAYIGDAQVTYAKIQDMSAISRLLGRGSAAGVGDVEEIILGTNLSMSGTTLNATGGGGAPTDATYWVGAAHAGLSAEINLGALGTGLVLNTAGTPSILAGNTCAANNFGVSLSASGVLGCAQPAFSNLSGTLALSQTSMNTARLIGRTTAGVGVFEEITVNSPLTFSAGVLDITAIADADLASSYSGIGACGANTFASTLNDNAAPTCTQPAFSNLSGSATDAQVPDTITLTNITQITNRAISDTTGTLAIGRGGTGQTTITTNQLYVGTALDTLAAKTLPSCSNGTTSKLLYNNSTQEFSCGADQGGAGGSANVIEVSVNLGTGLGLVYSTTVTGQAWVTATSSIACSPMAVTTDGLTVETVAASGVQPIVSNRVIGDGFNLNVYSPHGASGIYRFGCTGA